MAETRSIDVRGLSCPQPMLTVTDALGALAGGMVEVWSDCGTAQDNITRAAARAGWSVATEEQPDGSVRFLLTR